ncbi:phosphatase 2C-like domain-containing protein [Hyaloraphidium curvatum]|nr:phosphatase 2C-like domain-containing protein [Hyaloraphidium curvatum]
MRPRGAPAAAMAALAAGIRRGAPLWPAADAWRLPDELVLLHLRGAPVRHTARPLSASPPAPPPRAPPPNIFSFFDDIGKHAVARPSLRLDLGVAAYPKTALSGASRKAAAAAIAGDGDYLSVGVGEDAYFRRHDAIGVADGVGGWSRIKGANPALYSRKLMHYSNKDLSRFEDDSSYDPEEYYAVDPRVVLERSYAAVLDDIDKENLVGSTTACLVILRDDELRIANLGDCGVLVIRGAEIIFRTAEQQHSFNFPFQLGTGSKDSPGDAETFTVKVKEGDVVIVASDGLFDNLFDDEILDIAVAMTEPPRGAAGLDPQKFADTLAVRCREVQEDPMASASPFQVKASEEGLFYEGGKQDDTTVVCGVVRLDADAGDRRSAPR